MAVIHHDWFTAAQAAQKTADAAADAVQEFTAAQAAQKLFVLSSFAGYGFTAAQAAQKN